MSAKFGKELTPPEAKSWKEILKREPSEAIEWAFKQYVRTPPNQGERKWFPEEWQIIELLRKWHVECRASDQQQEMDAARWTREQLRAEGQPAGEAQVAEIMKRLAEVAQKKGIPEHIQRQRAFDARLKKVAAVIPAMPLTPEEIQSRRDKDLEEIREACKSPRRTE